MGPIVPVVDELIIQILQMYMLFLPEYWWSHQVIILHMSWQRMCCNVYKIMTRVNDVSGNPMPIVDIIVF